MSGVAKQKTIKKEVSLEGVGLHTGKNVKLKFLPAPPNSGILFFREDTSSLIKADLYSVLSPENFPRRTSIGRDGVYIHTVEHLMAALSILGIDNIQINITGEEVPGMDGSARDFIENIKKAGIVEQPVPKDYLVVREPIWVDEGSAGLVILPYPEFRISYTLDYNNPTISTDFLDVVLGPENIDSLAIARTFCLEEEVAPLLNMGLGKGANYSNTLVVSKEGVLENKLRDEEEFVKHKVLDLIGDLYLAGPLKGHVIAFRSGHLLNIKLLTKLRAYKEKVTSSGVGAVSTFIPSQDTLDASEIMKILPHRYPFLLVDKIIYLEKGKKAIGIKNVTINDYFFQGHFPDRPIMPGVLIIEVMAQVGGVLMLSPQENRGKLAYFMAANNIKFRRTVEPGDQLVIEVTVGKVKSKTGQVHTKAFVDNKVVAEADLMFALVNR
ncbi:MAG TPA: UDP-3-O-[3-hydroxymyristoyl] N-acetylglucosamine deacetylase [Candidatus Omnitrophica bacterium]|nr:MAG: 3-hydroxyacyl-[acyl-carrier-protein] dehydratase FabZ [Candidatus Omnitrophota bacterium]RKY45007.1 MAG: 3-hydroxyacyl-[acyl-carrier-protein] dehydratase FabZ [Candidatus Omnitrophota bacterium]HEC68840.1 UDP-3-O-[3-hydroxymyristoyl] N-acetylglucosamine deacetylase [Candidatus Omnitrophota bacterium]